MDKYFTIDVKNRNLRKKKLRILKSFKVYFSATYVFYCVKIENMHSKLNDIDWATIAKEVIIYSFIQQC